MELKSERVGGLAREWRSSPGAASGTDESVLAVVRSNDESLGSSTWIRTEGELVG